jgi:hypothetical protein
MQVTTAARAECGSLQRQALGPAKGLPRGKKRPAWHCHGWPPAPVATTCQHSRRPVLAHVAQRSAGETIAPTKAADVPAQTLTDAHDLAPPPPRPSLSPTLLLVGVTLLWGTFTPALRFLYALDHPPSPALLTALRTVIAAAALLAISPLLAAPTAVNASVQRDDGTTPLPPPSRSLVSPMLWAAAQLAMFDFLSTELQTLGLQATTATKGAFLGQLTAVITPTLVLATGGTVPGAIWAACSLGMVGGVMVTLDSSPAAALAQDMPSVDAAGPAAILLGCVFYSLLTVQLSKFAPRYDSLQLASAKVVCLAVLSVAWYGWEVATGEPCCPCQILPAAAAPVQHVCHQFASMRGARPYHTSRHCSHANSTAIFSVECIGAEVLV